MTEAPRLIPYGRQVSEEDRHLRLAGERIYLRPVVESDATPAYVSWLMDAETTRYLESGGRVETIESVAAYIRRYQDRADALFLAVVLKDNDVHVGNVKLEPINWRHRNAVLGIMLGSPQARGHGIGGEAITLVLRYGFEVLQLHRVALGVTADNEPAIRCYRKLGFTEEGRLREAVRREHGFVDSLCMGILAGEFGGRSGSRGP